MFSGAVSDSAVAYATPLTLNQSVLIKARTLDGTNWSALSEAGINVEMINTSEVRVNVVVAAEKGEAGLKALRTAFGSLPKSLDMRLMER